MFLSSNDMECYGKNPRWGRVIQQRYDQICGYFHKTGITYV